MKKNKQQYIIRLKFLSQKSIIENSFGEVKNTETISYKTNLPIEEGLYSQSIFGPIKSFSCSCMQQKNIPRKYHTKNVFEYNMLQRFRNINDDICKVCNVPLINSKEWKFREGHIELPFIILNPMILKSNNFISKILNISDLDLRSIVMLERYILIPNRILINHNFKVFSIEDIYNKFNIDCLNFNILLPNQNILSTGSEAIFKILKNLNMEYELDFLLRKIKARPRLIKRYYKKIEALQIVINYPKIIDDVFFQKYLPILPCDLWPLLWLDNGTIGVFSLTHLYREFILSINRYKELMNESSFLILVWNQRHIIDRLSKLFNNHKYNKKQIWLDIPSNDKNLNIKKSIIEYLKDKKGIIRNKMLGFWVDFSARAVIIAGPDLKIFECGIPKKIAIKLFQPEILAYFCKKYNTNNFYTFIPWLKNLLDDELIETLLFVTKGQHLLINWAPTLHKFSVQSFAIKIIDGDCIALNPNVCAAFNADHDGDTVAVFRSVSKKSLIESYVLLSSQKCLFLPSNGHLIASPSRECITGCYFITSIDPNYKIETGKDLYIFNSLKEIHLALKHRQINIWEYVYFVLDDKLIKTTPGRLIINEVLPQDVRRYDCVFDKNFFEMILKFIAKWYGFYQVNKVLNAVKDIGFFYATRYAITLNINDIKINIGKRRAIDYVYNNINRIQKLKQEGIIDDEALDTYKLYAWDTMIESLKKKMLLAFDKQSKNNLNLMQRSKGRGNLLQMTQLCLMKGLVWDANNNILKDPILNSLYEGLLPHEYFLSCFGSWKSIIDKTLRTAVSGYLTRKLVLSSDHMIIDRHDCYTDLYEEVTITKDNLYDCSLKLESHIIVENVKIQDTIFYQQQVFLQKETTLIKSFIHNRVVDKITFKIWNVSCCKSINNNICQWCYGYSLSEFYLVNVGEPIGIIAGQSIGEPGTQMTMRTFHSGGIASDLKPNLHIIKSKYKGRIKFDIQHFIKIQNTNFYIAKYDTIVNIIDQNVPLEKIKVLKDSILLYALNSSIESNKELIIKFNNFSIVYAFKSGKIKFDNIIILNNVWFNNITSYVFTKQDAKKDSFIYIINDQGVIIYRYKLNIKDIILIKEGIDVKIGALLYKKSLSIKEKNLDIVGSLPKVQSLFEKRKSNNYSKINLQEGYFFLDEEEKMYWILDKYCVNKTTLWRWLLSKDIHIKYECKLTHTMLKNICVMHGSYIQWGQPLTNDRIDFDHYVDTFGLLTTKWFLWQWIISIFIENGIYVHTKHFDVIINSLFRFVKLTYIPKDLWFQLYIYKIVPKMYIDNINEQWINWKQKDLIKYKHIMIGLSNSILQSDNVLMSFSFQYFTKMIIRHAQLNQMSSINSIWDNVLVGHNINAGTMFKDFDHRYEYYEKIFRKDVLWVWNLTWSKIDDNLNNINTKFINQFLLSIQEKFLLTRKLVTLLKNQSNTNVIDFYKKINFKTVMKWLIKHLIKQYI